MLANATQLQTTVTNQLTSWSQSIHQKAANVSNEKLQKANLVIAGFAILAFAKGAYDLYQGDYSYVIALPVIPVVICLGGKAYVESVKNAVEALKNTATAQDLDV